MVKAYFHARKKVVKNDWRKIWFYAKTHVSFSVHSEKPQKLTASCAIQIWDILLFCHVNSLKIRFLGFFHKSFCQKNVNFVNVYGSRKMKIENPSAIKVAFGIVVNGNMVLTQ